MKGSRLRALILLILRRNLNKTRCNEDFVFSFFGSRSYSKIPLGMQKYAPCIPICIPKRTPKRHPKVPFSFYLRIPLDPRSPLLPSSPPEPSLFFDPKRPPFPRRPPFFFF